MSIQYENKLGPRQRSPWLLFIHNNQVSIFQEQTIPGVAVIVGSDYKKAGVWSGTTFRIQLAPGVNSISGHFGFETNTFREGLADATFQKHCDRWVDVANALGVTLCVAQDFLRAWLPKEASHFDSIEANLQGLDDVTPCGSTTLSISYGSPTNRMRDEGFWSWPVLILDSEGREVGRVDPEGIPTGNVKVLSREKANGFHGGTISLLLAVPEGSQAVHGQPDECRGARRSGGPSLSR